jgi:MoaA/NifB/PqqE/SkfB family radical SAM enzyme
MLACIHCRAEAIQKPLPGELGTAEAMELIDRIASFGSPGPILVITGGDPLIRVDL